MVLAALAFFEVEESPSLPCSLPSTTSPLAAVAKRPTPAVAMRSAALHGRVFADKLSEKQREEAERQASTSAGL